MWYNVAYTNEQGNVVAIITEAESEDDAKRKFAERSPQLEIISAWARADFVPA